MPHPYPFPQLRPLFDLSATLERFDDLGETPQGHRMMGVIGQGGGPSAEIECAAKCYTEAAETGCFCVPTGQGSSTSASRLRPTTRR